MNQYDCTVLVCSCDSYEDAWEPFFKLFHEYWPDCTLKILLNTESKYFTYPGLNIQCLQKFRKKKPTYGKRMIEHLKMVETPFTLVLMDDFFLRSPVIVAELDKVIRWMKTDPKAAVFSFQPIDDELNRPSSKYEGYNIRPVYGEYKYNFQAGIWRTDYLLHSWKKHETPWEWETRGSFRSFNKRYNFYVLNPQKALPIDYGFQNKGMGIFRGKWVKESVMQLFEEHQINVDYRKRGFYEDKDKNIIRMKNTSRISDEFRVVKSYGVQLYVKIFIWRTLRKLSCCLGNDVPKDYIDFLRKKSEENSE